MEAITTLKTPTLFIITTLMKTFLVVTKDYEVLKEIDERTYIGHVEAINFKDAIYRARRTFKRIKDFILLETYTA